VIVVVDNRDSFVHNLARYARELGHETIVVRCDAVSVDDVAALGPSHIVLSPGPCTPDEAGVSVDLVRELGPSVPVLGVCLGHQCIATAYGGRVERGRPVHGKRSLVHHDGRGVYAGLVAPFAGARYHSLVATDLPDVLRSTARTADGVLMGVRHARFPVEGVQVHPESVLTALGDRILAAFLDQPDGVPVTP
jgi:anthranilate synthase/aminodeoxychorismate synthase-like glutamine amidotransferase